MSSILKVNQIQDIGGNTIVSSDGTGGFTNNLPAGKSGSFRNIIINGDMSIAQRGTSATALGNGDSGYHTCDRWKFIEAGTPTYEFTMLQDTDVPTGQGFATSLKMDVTTAQGSLAAGDVLFIEQPIEGQNLQYLKKGTSSAESLTLSFWVKSVKTGTYIIELKDEDNSRSISKSYTIDSASTWEKKTITFDGDTTGAFDNDNASSLRIFWWLAAGTTYASGTLQTSWGSQVTANRAVGQVNLADNTANEWYITGVQLEASGGVASDFEFLPHDVNLERCHRYYYLFPSGTNHVIGNASAYTNTTAYSVIMMKTEMRTQPTLDQVSGSNYFTFLTAGNSRTFDTLAISGGSSTNKTIRINNSDTVTTSSGDSGWFQVNNASAYVALDAEL